MTIVEIVFVRDGQLQTGEAFTSLSKQLLDSDANRKTKFGGVSGQNDRVMTRDLSDFPHGILSVQAENGVLSGFDVVGAVFSGANMTLVTNNSRPRLVVQLPKTVAALV